MADGLHMVKNNKLLVYLILLTVSSVVISCLLGSCVQFPAIPPTLTSGQTFALTDAEVFALKSKALTHNDASAAIRLEKFYSCTVGDYVESLRWMKLAARLGDAGAIAYLKAEDKRRNRSVLKETP